jgi:chemotaxis protein CheD
MINPETDVCLEEKPNIGVSTSFDRRTRSFDSNSQHMSFLDRSEPEEKLLVRLAEFIVVKSERALLATHHLGAGLGIAIHDPIRQIGGLLHAMLPDSSAGSGKPSSRPGMFVDTGMTALLNKAYELGAKSGDMKIYVAGGGQIMDSSGLFNPGKINHEALCNFLNREGLKIQAENVGGLVNRIIHLNLRTGEVRVKFSGDHKDKLLCNPLTTL